MPDNKQLPAEVVQAAEKMKDFVDANHARLERLKGDGEDSPTRAAAAVALRVDGAGYPDIAKILDYSSAQRARRAIEDAISEQAGSPEEIEHVRFINNRRIERMIQSVMTRATDPHDADHLAYLRAAMVLVDRQLRLFGADAPAQMKVIHSPATAEIENWVNKLAKTLHGAADEADIIDVEIVQSEEGDF